MFENFIVSIIRAIIAIIFPNICVIFLMISVVSGAIAHSMKVNAVAVDSIKTVYRVILYLFIVLSVGIPFFVKARIVIVAIVLAINEIEKLLASDTKVALFILHHAT